VINPQGERTTWQFDANSRVAVQRLANLIRVSYAYDVADRLIRLANLSSTGTTITSYRDTWEGAGNRLSRVEQDGTRVTWSYDPTYQLTRERRGGANSYDTTYAYDAAGNRRLKLDNSIRTTYAYDAANQLQQYLDNNGTTTFVFDASGNQRLQQAPSSGATTNTWDFENRLTKVAMPAGMLNTFVYNGDNLRIERHDSTGTLKDIWDGLRILEETDQNDSVQAVYTMSLSMFGDVVSQRRSGVGNYYLFEPLGSTMRLTDGSQNVTDTYLYKAFGEILLAGATINPFEYVGRAGYYYDSAAGLYLLTTRHFSPSLARFLVWDPKWPAPGDWNQYAYVGNNPSAHIDPSGHAWGDWYCYALMSIAIGNVALCWSMVSGGPVTIPIICFCIASFFTICSAITSCLLNNAVFNTIKSICSTLAAFTALLCAAISLTKPPIKPPLPPAPPPTTPPAPPQIAIAAPHETVTPTM
jgi:RHS repeat-associated protein